MEFNNGHDDFHSFNVGLAVKYSMVEALLLYSFAHWTRLNAANEHNYHDGRYWTYNKLTALQKYYPYLGIKALRGALKKLEKNGLIIRGCYNKLKFDRTTWYALTDLGLKECKLTTKEDNEPVDTESIPTELSPPVDNFKSSSPFAQKGKCINKGVKIIKNAETPIFTHLSKRANGIDQKGNTIPITNTVTNHKNVNVTFVDNFENRSIQDLVKKKLGGDKLTLKQTEDLIRYHYDDNYNSQYNYIEKSLDNFVAYLKTNHGKQVKKPIAVFLDRIKKDMYWPDKSDYNFPNDKTAALFDSTNADKSS